jgi:hypothetical protein
MTLPKRAKLSASFIFFSEAVRVLRAIELGVIKHRKKSFSANMKGERCAFLWSWVSTVGLIEHRRRENQVHIDRSWQNKTCLETKIC